jgi:UDP-N-acetylglucosamine pyrophosphorylase
MQPNAVNESHAAKMRVAGIAEPTIAAFLGALKKVRAGDRGILPEAAITPITSFPKLDEIDEAAVADNAMLRQLVVFKLNGGLGTSMGLDRTKSLIPVRGNDTFLDFTVRQMLRLRNRTGSRYPAFYLMNSLITRGETLEFLRRYPDLAGQDGVDFLQSMVPKVDPQTFAPVSWPQQPDLEWCPPGHGDFYPSILGCGLLDRLLNSGVRYAFVSNSDNLGANVDLRLLRYFAERDIPFLMEVARRTAADKKGGHLARRRETGRLLLRESAQSLKEEEARFQDIQRYCFFNTNNLWIRLDHVRTELQRNCGVLPLPLITNVKNVDPRNPATPKVLQLESAMGAAIECFDGADAIVVARSRFAPVKATVDLAALRSDAYLVTSDDRLELVPSRQGRPPLVDLDPEYYKVMASFEGFLPVGVPSLVACDSLKVTGPVELTPSVICQGTVEFHNASAQTKRAAPGVYNNQRVEL